MNFLQRLFLLLFLVQIVVEPDISGMKPCQKVLLLYMCVFTTFVVTLSPKPGSRLPYLLLKIENVRDFRFEKKKKKKIRAINLDLRGVVARSTDKPGTLYTHR